MTRPDTEGRLLPMIRGLAGFARTGGAIGAHRSHVILATLEGAVANGTHLAHAPKFVVTATA